MVGKEMRKSLKETAKKTAGDDPKPAKQRRNRFWAFLQTAWRRITRCFTRCFTRCNKVRPYSQERSSEERPGPSGINIADSREVRAQRLSPTSRHLEQEPAITLCQSMKISSSVQSTKAVRSRWKIPSINSRLIQVKPLYASSNSSQSSSMQTEEDRDIGALDMKEPSINSRLIQVKPLYASSNSSQSSSMQKEERDIGALDMKEPGINSRLIQVKPLYASSNSSQSSSMQKEERDIGALDMKEPSINSRLIQVKPLYASSNSSQSSSMLKEERDIGALDMKEPAATQPISLESFVIHKKLGSGGFGKVYLATEINSNTQVAIKMMAKWVYVREEMYFTERDILRINHQSPYLIHGLGAFSTLNHVCYVMEFAANGSLAEFIFMTTSLDKETIVFIMAELVCGVQFLHDQGIIHRDLKPDNILITAGKHIKITDFGLCIFEKNQTTEKYFGTPGYVAPEAVLLTEYGPAVDYYSLGVILYELCAPYLPYLANDAQIIFTEGIVEEYLNNQDPDSLDFLQGLRHKEQNLRLSGKDEVRRHPFFSSIKWEDVDNFRIQPPEKLRYYQYEPPIHYDGDEIVHWDKAVFQDFNFVCSEWSAYYHPK